MEPDELARSDDLNNARVEEQPLNLNDSVVDPRQSVLAHQVPQEPTTLMTAAGLRAAACYDGIPLMPSFLRAPPFNWPRPGEHT